MPIKKENLHRYPKNWKEIRARILDRAGNKCEWPGCAVPNYSRHPVTHSRVILTIGHLNHTPEDVADSNLRAWCQLHHLAYDLEHHLQSAYRNRREGKAIEMFK